MSEHLKVEIVCSGEFHSNIDTVSMELPKNDMSHPKKMG